MSYQSQDIPVITVIFSVSPTVYKLWRAESNEDTQRLLSICKYELWNIEVNILSVSVCSLMNVDNILKVLTEGVRWKQFVKFSLTMNKGANILFQM